MKTKTSLYLTILGLLMTSVSVAQGVSQNCSAAFLGKRMLVNEYSPQGVCRVKAQASGQLTVCTVDLSPTESKAVAKIPFRIAIRDAATKTLMMYSKEDFREINLQSVLAKCRKGDHIVLMTLDKRYALPHNEIVVE